MLKVGPFKNYGQVKSSPASHVWSQTEGFTGSNYQILWKSLFSVMGILGGRSPTPEGNAYM